MNDSDAKYSGGMTVVGMAGSLRSGSLNRMLINEVARVASGGMRVSVFEDLRGVPLFDWDEELRHPLGPGAVADLRQRVRAADGLIIATPEYNQSIPGVMKNAVDWLSRPDDASALDGKPVAILGTTDGPWGTRYAQKELRHTLTSTGAIVMPQPMFFLARGQEAFGPAGRLTDPEAERRLAQFVAAFATWIRLVAAPDLVATGA